MSNAVGLDLDQIEALQRVREIHHQAAYPNDSLCDGCGYGWHCETVRALDAALDGEIND